MSEFFRLRANRKESFLLRNGHLRNSVETFKLYPLSNYGDNSILPITTGQARLDPTCYNQGCHRCPRVALSGGYTNHYFKLAPKPNDVDCPKEYGA